MIQPEKVLKIKETSFYTFSPLLASLLNCSFFSCEQFSFLLSNQEKYLVLECA